MVVIKSSTPSSPAQMRPSLARLLQAFTPFKPLKPTPWQTAAPVQPLRPPPRGSGLSNAEIIRLGDDRVRALFNGVDEADVVEEIIEARRGIWGGPSGGRSSLPSPNHTSATALRDKIVDLKLTRHAKAKRNQINGPRTRRPKRRSARN